MLHVVELTEGAYAVGLTLAAFAEQKMPLKLASLSRGGFKSEEPDPNIELKAGDVLVLIGTQEEVYLAEEKLLQG